MEIATIYEDDKVVYQHNAITSGRYDFSSCMLDILFMVLAGLKKDELTYTIYAKDIEIITGRKWNLQQLREATETMGSRVFEIETNDRFTQLWLFSKVDYLTGTGSFEVKINSDAAPYFFELKNNFTAMQLKSLLACSSKYAKRLYALACQWRSVGYKKMEILELKEMLDLVDKKGNEKYRKINDFKKSVLEIAKKQINKFSDIEFDYKLTKNGRSYHYITIYFNGSKFINQLELPLDFTQNVEYQRKVSAIIANGISKAKAEKWAETKQSWAAFVEAKETTLIKIQKGEVVNDFSRYIVGIMKKKGF